MKTTNNYNMMNSKSDASKLGDKYNDFYTWAMKILEGYNYTVDQVAALYKTEKTIIEKALLCGTLEYADNDCTYIKGSSLLNYSGSSSVEYNDLDKIINDLF